MKHEVKRPKKRHDAAHFEKDESGCVLLTFTGFHDPYSPGLIAGQEHPGPILSLLGVRPFTRVVLFSTPGTIQNTYSTTDAIRGRYPAIEVENVELNTTDPTNHEEILRLMREQLSGIVEREQGASLFVSVASGTPQMHACWVLLVASGELPACLLQIRPHRFVTDALPLLTEINLSSPAFPVVRMPPVFTCTEDLKNMDLDAIVKDLQIVADHPRMQKALQITAAVAASNRPVLILGETGTGKELFARLLHRLSGKPHERFIALNCGAIPKDLVESTLFGHRRGAFTGAVADQEGKFDRADTGTLFLDEIGELPLDAQAKLLRVIEDGEVERIGDRSTHKVDVRIIAATHRKLREMVQAGTFREDLYFRLAVVKLPLPPLRERRTDIPKIALQVLDRVNASLSRSKRLTPAALRRLQLQLWSGNVRALRNVIEASICLTSKDILDADDLVIEEGEDGNDLMAFLPEPHEGFSMDDFIENIRHRLYMKALDLADNNQTAAGRLLDVSAQSVSKFIRDHKIRIS